MGLWLYLLRVFFPPITLPAVAGLLEFWALVLRGTTNLSPTISFGWLQWELGGEAGDLSSHRLFCRCISIHSFLDGPYVVSPSATLYFANLLPFPFLIQGRRSRTGGM